MPFRSTVLGALLLASGCAGNPSIDPAAKPRDVRVARTAGAPHPVESVAADEPVGARARKPPASDAEPPRGPPAPTPPSAAGSSRADPFGDVGFKEIDEKDWLTGIRDNIVRQEKVAPTDLCLSPGLLRAAFVRSWPDAAPARPGRRIIQAHAHRHEIVVVDNQGRRIASFRPIVSHGSDEPPRDLRFLSDERLVYEVIASAPAVAPKKAPATKSNGRSGARARNAKSMLSTARATPTAVPPVPPRLFVIQPLAPRARPVRCQGFDFTFAPKHDRLAFVGGHASAAFVAVDGIQVYPRRGHTTVASAPLWSKDGHSLAFLEQPAAHPARLVLVAEPGEPTGDRAWDLPADSNIEGASVYWAGASKLVVRRSATTRPIFSTSFGTDR